MEKKKIKKLELHKKEVLDLSRENMQNVLGGGSTLTYDFGATCPQTVPANCDPNQTNDCEGGGPTWPTAGEITCGYTADDICHTGDWWVCTRT
ncbi:class I lanthipeptide [Chryseobacterium luteum]|uniref:Natural product n=1 Tax=Chryseobacterium luteum TaxID=421531 RepID=A0A085ZWX6_9FLAO|nr:class I lanthipeptide [Chryseobacterium luteum]KFF08940.1 hypothetical protein IX38_00020 [Chryseobacterium luteum]